MQEIFIVEDDDNIRDMLLYALSSTEFTASGFNDGGKFWEAVEQTSPTLILLDIMLPGEDGITILKKLKKSSKHKGIPVIMLTAKGSEYDRISGLDMGADDYIAKPFSVLEVISRIRAVLRRCAPDEHEDVSVSVGKIVLQLDKRSVSSDGSAVVLTFKEFELLHYLMINEGIVMTRDKLLTQVWGFDYNGESRTVDMHIRSLRQKLGGSSDIIKTVRNVGYKIEDNS